MRKLQNIETRIYKIGLNFGSRLNEMEKKMYLLKKSNRETREVKPPSLSVKRRRMIDD